MWPWNKKDKDNITKRNQIESAPIISVDLKTVKKAIRKFAEEAPTGVTTQVLVKDDHSIDFELLLPYLKGIPDKNFYMSKETYEVFEEHDKELPVYIDTIQAAVDKYITSHQKTPKIAGDPYHKVSYLILESNGLIHERPPIDLYLTTEENLITHKKPE